MKEAKSEAEKIIASYKADMEANYQVSLAKVCVTLSQSLLIVYNYLYLCRFLRLWFVSLTRVIAAAARLAQSLRRPQRRASPTCSKFVLSEWLCRLFHIFLTFVRCELWISVAAIHIGAIFMLFFLACSILYNKLSPDTIILPPSLITLSQLPLWHCIVYYSTRNEYDKKKQAVEKMLIQLVLKVDTTVPKARIE